ncbi:MAG: VCBS repeat-containing protein [Planctomycetota bacterium]|nr:VCBS repeat-containing protein [Planctomycetota bacterium]
MLMDVAATLMVLASSLGHATSDPVLRPDQWLEVADQADAPSFGAAMAMQDSLLAVSNGDGAVLIYELNDGSWEFDTRLEPTTPSDGFGIAISTDGTRVVVLDETSGPAVYRYNFLNSSWVDESVADLTGTGKTFTSLDFEGLTAGDDMVVCFDDNGTRGFHTLNGTVSFGGAIWSLSDTETVSGSFNDYFGQSVDLDGEWIAVGVPPEATTMYEEWTSGIWVASGSILRPVGMLGNFGQSVSLDGTQLAIGAPGTESDFVTEAGEVAICEFNTSSSAWSVVERLENPYGGEAFAHRVLLKDDALLVAVPGRVTGFNMDPGRLVLLRRTGGTWAGATQFRALTSFFSRSYYQFGGPGMAFDGQTVAASSTGGQSLANPLNFLDGDVCTFHLDVASSRFWQSADEASIGSSGAWTTTDGSRAIFALPNNTNHVVVLDGTTTFEQLVVRDDTVFDLDNDTSTFGNSFVADLPALRINGPSIYGPATATLTGPGTMELENDLQLGANGHKGTLIIDDLADLNIQGSLLMDHSGTLDIVAGGDAPSALTGVSVAGGLNVSLPEDFVPVEGTTYTLLESGATPNPGEDTFSLVSLPGLPGGLAFDLQYGASSARSVWSVSAEIVTLSELLGFGDPESTTVDTGAIDLEVVDLTGDDIDELCVLFDGNPAQMAIFNVNATGDIVEQIIFNVGNDPVGLTSGDLDGDTSSTNDLAIANSNQSVQVLINLDNNPSNGFDITSFSVGALTTSVPTCIAAAQVDLTSTAKELVVGFDNGDGTGAFTTYSALPLRGAGYGEADNHNTTSPVTNANPLDDEDKKLIPWGGTKEDGDVVVAKRESLAGPGLPMTYSSYPAADSLADIALRDLDDDGDTDIVVTSAANNTLVLLEQITAGVFGAPVSIAAGTSPGRLATADFNGDGETDIAALTTNSNGSTVIRIFENGGSFIFTTTDVGEGESPTLVDAGDVDGDGEADLVSIAAGGALLRGGTPTLAVRASCTCIGDTDCSQQVDVEDLLNVLSEYGCTSECEHDVDGDGLVDIEDLLAIIGNWQGCAQGR